MKKNLLYIILPLLFCFNACNLQDESQIPDEFNTVELNDLIPAAMSQLAYNQSALHGRISGRIMQYFQSLDSRIVFGVYNLEAGHFNTTWGLGFYGGSLASANEMKRIAIEDGNQNVHAISLILMANEFMSLATTFGDIPFTEALQGADNITPKYDTQEVVYDGIIEMLTEATVLIGSAGLDNELAQSDLVYGGDMQAWKKLANGLTARCLVNLQKQVPGLESQILSLVDASFSNRSEQANYNFDLINACPLGQFGKRRPGTLVIHPIFANILITTGDPRLLSYAVSDFPEWNFYDGEVSQLTWAQFDSSIPILSYTELLFMKAEVEFHMGASMDDVNASLVEAISSNMEDNNIELDSDVQSFISEAANLEGLNDEEVLQNIIEQAYISYYGYNFEQAWSNYRRTGYPEIENNEDLNSVHNPSNIIPRRILYPESEVEYNNANYLEAVTRQGGDLMDDEIWLFQN